ncbi:MAG: PUR family DNA/RNA-binding protein [Bacteroidetes bacterium]|nr:PUR family DNA/RNA-binding protein [Bacteroidota bacterium]MBT3751188.1 PUR family DNA/RNA-binding protein [Bacteroidota bacterium]MBT4398547.1 PUR family DNA/RNA-binding protein [Bacteroidota bacterium]MBT4411933.1 PUR family DNA/RNA-binding protein [Bacteroidota bacterium]MBT5426990.1 PUR family DNA/RNA-binding protein [Bacteroidota bacterium]
MAEFDKKEGIEQQDREEIFSKVVRAGKRTYFFDVKATRKDDYYLTITESKKIFDKDGRFHFEKHKLFLYKEDFQKFEDGLYDAIEYIRKVKGSFEEDVKDEVKTESNSSFSNVEFEDLDGGK